jgi:hypothetical protein
MKQRSQVPLNDPSDAFVIFRDELTPSIIDVRGEQVSIDLEDFAHLWAHVEMLSRIRWIGETLRNPEEIRQHPNKNKRYREIYLNTVFTDENDQTGEPHLVVVHRGLKLKFWTSFVPDRPGYVEQMRKGKLLWKPSD